MYKRKTGARGRRGRAEERGVAGGKRGGGGQGNPYPVELRMRVVREVIEGGVSAYKLSRVFGITHKTIERWVLAYRAEGVDGLVPKPPFGRGVKPTAGVKRDAVVALREEHPEYGTRRIRDLLRRFEALGVSETEVRRLLHEEGLIETLTPSVEREHPPRRFERAQPNQLWQSDIFTFLLRRHERLYLTAFMDDHSRFIVSQALAHHQRSELVMEALERGVAAFGPPREILTDNGRQYTAWRGKTAFEEALRREGIDHIRSRPQQPQTLGKVERFWKTLWDEFLSRTVFSDFVDCQRRLAAFIDHYNFQRPHQGLDGLVPADRYFGAAAHVRDAVENAVAENSLRLALDRPPQKPFYLVGRLGDRDLSIAASGSGLRVQLDGEEPETIQLPKENDDEELTLPNRIRDRATATQEQSKTDTEVATGAARSRRGGEEALPDDFDSPQWREAGYRRDRRSEDFAPDVLPTGRASLECDASGVIPGSDWRRDGVGGRDQASAGARGENRAARAGATSRRSPAALDAQDGHSRDVESSARQAETDSRDEAGELFEDAFKNLERLTEGLDLENVRGPFDPTDGWRGRALTWDRKLAGSDAAVDARSPEASDGEKEAEVHETARD